MPVLGHVLDIAEMRNLVSRFAERDDNAIRQREEDKGGEEERQCKPFEWR